MVKESARLCALFELRAWRASECMLPKADQQRRLETPMREMVRVSGARWPIERCFQENKSELVLDHYEHRSWTARHLHMRLVFLAQLFLLRLQNKFRKKLPLQPCRKRACSWNGASRSPKAKSATF